MCAVKRSTDLHHFPGVCQSDKRGSSLCPYPKAFLASSEKKPCVRVKLVIYICIHIYIYTYIYISKKNYVLETNHILSSFNFKDFAQFKAPWLEAFP
jgi:hypothetical protein